MKKEKLNIGIRKEENERMERRGRSLSSPYGSLMTFVLTKEQKL